VAEDLTNHTQAQIVISGRTPDRAERFRECPNSRVDYLVLDLADRQSLQTAIAAVDLVIHCAGPFRYRDASVLETCIELGVNYLDVSDDRVFTTTALAYRTKAQAAEVTAVINSGVFPGISNSMVRQGVERLDTAERIHLSYAVAGSGGAGASVMRTTFLNLQHPFPAWIDGQWKVVNPYTERETIEFPPPFKRVGVYWFDMPEGMTLVDSFSARTVTTKFGISPAFYNRLTWIAAHWLPAKLLQQPRAIEFLARVSDRMTAISDRFTGTGVAVRSEIGGQLDGRLVRYCSTLVHPDAAIATGCGTGSIAQSILSGQISKPGVWTPEQVLPTHLFEAAMQSRGINIHQCWL
jgi:saccharopine dehydrogenase-like NADP-dependent oxidoreductase